MKVLAVLIVLGLSIAFPGPMLGILLALVILGVVLFIGYLGNKEPEDEETIWLYKSDEREYNETGEWN